MNADSEHLNIAVDADGFLVDPGQWNEAVAERLAEADGVGPLGDAHWAVIRALRHHWEKTHGLPAPHHICHETHQPHHCLETLFGGSLREAWRIAGLPNPGTEAMAYM